MKAMSFKTAVITVLIILVSAGSFAAQAMTVKGTVYDTGDRSAMVGVYVVLKGTSKGVITDEKGAYKIEANQGDQLVFSYLGYKMQTIKVTGNTLDVYMETDSKVLEEVVVTGYSVQKKCLTTGAIAHVGDRISTEAAGTKDVYFNQGGANFNRYSPSQPAISPAYPGNEEYLSFSENKFKSASEDPLSTFSIDVDAASYSNIRRFINQGQLPGKDAVRTEELINYFSYNYSKPTGNDPVKITTEVGNCPWNKMHRLVRIGIKAKELASDKMPASNFVFLIDVSGSMEGPSRLDLVKSSLKLLTNNLREKDRVAIVVYAGAAGEVLPSTSGTDKQKIREALDRLSAGGSTAGGAGIALAYKIAGKNFIPGGNNRIILCTDGDFNVGISSNDQLESMIEKERKSSGVFLTILGYGMGNYKDSKMQILAEKGNGNHAYIDNIQEANKVLVNEFGGTMYAVAKDVKLQIEFNPAKVQSYRLIGYESRLLNKEDFNDDTKDAGEMGAGHTVTAFYEVVPTGVEGSIQGSVDELKYQKNPAKVRNTDSNDSPDLLTVKLRYKQPDGDTSKKIEQALIDKGGNNVSSDFRFAAAVAMFGQLLSGSDFKGDTDYGEVIALAKTALADDDQGYRREFVRLAESVKGMEK